MSIIRFFYRYNKQFSVVFVLLTIISGIFNGLIIAFINAQIKKIGQPSYRFEINDLYVFAGILVSFLALRWLVSAGIIRFSIRMIHNLRLQIIEKLRNIEYREFEKIGDEDIFTILIRDTSTISNAASSFVYFFSSIITVVFCLCYMLWLFPIGFLLTIVVLVLGLGLYLLNQKKIIERLNEARELEAVFHKQVEDFVKGFKEIKISNDKREDIFENHIYKTSDRVRSLNTISLISYLNNNVLGQSFFYILLGFVLFYFPENENANQVNIVTYLFLIIYILGPITGIAQMIPLMAFVKVAINQLTKLEVDILSIKDEFVFQETSSKENIDFQSIRFENVYFSYAENDSENEFSLGPINISINKAKRHLIFGENGGGKSTFIKLLTGLYRPVSGRIFLNGEELQENGYDDFRNLFSAVYSDFYLFDTPYGIKNMDEDEFKKWLVIMKIEHKVEIVNGKFSTINLSSGQRKRLALVLSIQENKAILILDEWAAEQDPEFKSYFYKSILPQLIAEERTIVFISHDEKYFDCTDEMFRIMDGAMNSVDVNMFEYKK